MVVKSFIGKRITEFSVAGAWRVDLLTMVRTG